MEGAEVAFRPVQCTGGLEQIERCDRIAEWDCGTPSTDRATHPEFPHLSAPFHAFLKFLELNTGRRVLVTGVERAEVFMGLDMPVTIVRERLTDGAD